MMVLWHNTINILWNQTINSCSRHWQQGYHNKHPDGFATLICILHAACVVVLCTCMFANMCLWMSAARLSKHNFKTPTYIITVRWWGQHARLTPKVNGFLIRRICHSWCTWFVMICCGLTQANYTHKLQWPLLLTWFNFNHSMDK